ncbi:MAG: MerR family transcriptional regulator [Chloroflexi bacterium]|nr:MerR family transcriptional regulator [Chloroflexota bacterium]
MHKIGDFSRLSQVSVKALRYYDEIGLLKPAHIDPFTNYRYYSSEQLPRLNRILALKDLGLSLEQIGLLLVDELPVAAMQAMLSDKQAEIARAVEEQRARLARVEARLRQIEREGQPPAYDVVLKPVEPQLVLGARDVVACYGSGDELFGRVVQHLGRHGLDPASCYPLQTLYYDPEYRESDVDMMVAAPLPRPVPDGDGVHVEELPGVRVASVVHQGPYDALGGAYRALLEWLDTHRYCITGPNRNLYLQGPGDDADSATFVTEIQFPVEPRHPHAAG